MISVLPLVSRPSLLVLLHLSVLLLLLLLLVAVVSAETEVVAVPSTRTTTTSSSAATVATRGARPYYRSVLEVIDAYNLTAFRTAMERADFDLDRFFVSQQNLNSYKEDVSVTLFVPSNAAFDAIEDTILRRRVYGYNDSDHDHEEYWRDLVQYHVIEGKVWTSNEFIQGEQRLVRMVNDESVLVHKTTTANRNGDSYKFTVNGAHVLESNILAENGVVFIIDQVLLPKHTRLNIVERSRDIPDLTLWNQLIDVANLTHTLLYNENENENENEQQQPSFTTVFAPSSRALQNLGLDVLEQLKRPQNRPLLTDLLKYHMTSGIVIASLDILDDDGPLQDKTVTMWNGDPATVASSGTSNITHKYVQWRIQDANVRVLNVLCTNGVLKIIDRVMVPPSLDDPNRILPRIIQSADLGLSYASNPGATSIISSAATTTTAMNIQQSLTLFVFVVAFVVVFLLL